MHLVFIGGKIFGKKENNMTLILIISFLWAFLEGKREAQYFHYKWSLPNPTKVKDEHFEFTVQRSISVFLFCLVICLTFGWLEAIISLLSISFCFSFIHNGSYYKRRNELNSGIYKLGWKDNSISTTAKISMGYKLRLILFIIGFSLSMLMDVYLFIK